MKSLRFGLTGALSAALSLTGCAKTCTAIGMEEGLTIDWPLRVQEQVHALRVTLCSEGGCKEIQLTFDGFDRQGRAVLRHEEKFRFEPHFPNGEDCDGEPSLVHTTSVSSSDLLR